MASVKFHLRNSGGSLSAIYAVFNYDGTRLRLSTGEKISPEHWNPKAQRAKQSKQFPQHPEFNHHLQQMEEELLRMYRTSKVSKQPLSDETIKAGFYAYLKGGTGASQKVNDLFSFIEEFIEMSNKKYATKQVYRTTLNHLRQFSTLKKYPVSFDSIDLTFYNAFSAYLLKDLNLSNNGAGKYIKTLKTFLNEAVERGLTTNFSFKSKRFKTLKEEVDHIYLNEKELTVLYHLDLKDTPRLDRIKDLFLVGCYTGLRFSDFSRLQAEHLKGDMISLRTEKTDELVVIPRHPFVKAIIEKYDQKLPKAISNQRMNNYLKELGKIAGLTETVAFARTVAGVKEQNIKEKWTLITTHTARRSFATNAFLAGVPSISIMKITGHRTERAFLTYIKMSQEDNARKLQLHPFFAASPNI